MKTGPMRAEGRLIHAGSRVATAEGKLIDGAGKIYAHGSTTCLVFPISERV
jgi:acyl-coenzyme A thioesterase PaaI-like protein